MGARPRSQLPPTAPSPAHKWHPHPRRKRSSQLSPPPDPAGRPPTQPPLHPTRPMRRGPQCAGTSPVRRQSQPSPQAAGQRQRAEPGPARRSAAPRPPRQDAEKPRRRFALRWHGWGAQAARSAHLQTGGRPVRRRPARRLPAHTRRQAAPEAENGCTTDTRAAAGRRGRQAPHATCLLQPTAQPRAEARRQAGRWHAGPEKRPRPCLLRPRRPPPPRPPTSPPPPPPPSPQQGAPLAPPQL
eukprot:scaffold39870_cov101-Isochrysis_galbana.AAC.1